MMRTRTSALALAALIIGFGVAASHSLAGSRKPFKITSSLDGKKVLPLRSHWLAFPRPANKIKKVDFLIDGKLRWIELNPPYNYGSDENGRNLGYLITTWLTPGQHRFTVRAVQYSGRTATDTVTARVLPAPAPPASLAGKWTRTLTDDDLKNLPPDQRPPTGIWELIFDQVGEWHLDPVGSGVVNQIDVQQDTLNVYAPIQMSPLINNHTSTTRDGHKDIGGFDCNPAGPFGSYHWAVSVNTLTLTSTQEGCPGRQGILQGTWTRVP